VVQGRGVRRGRRAPARPRQANCSVSAAGVLRGIHFADVPPGQAKYVTCLTGAVLDVVVDIRVGSPTFGAWDSVLLDDVDRRAIYLGEGLGHAFLSLEDGSTVAYLCSTGYSPGREHGVHPLDPGIGIDWPTSARDGSALEVQLSDKDRVAPRCCRRATRGCSPTPPPCRSTSRPWLAEGPRFGCRRGVPMRCQTARRQQGKQTMRETARPTHLRLRRAAGRAPAAALPVVRWPACCSRPASPPPPLAAASAAVADPAPGPRCDGDGPRDGVARPRRHAGPHRPGRTVHARHGPRPRRPGGTVPAGHGPRPHGHRCSRGRRSRGGARCRAGPRGGRPPPRCAGGGVQVPGPGDVRPPPRSRVPSVCARCCAAPTAGGPPTASAAPARSAAPATTRRDGPTTGA
jgi:dTDP-4-dehydrorhamnose 3,5-epimerase